MLRIDHRFGRSLPSFRAGYCATGMGIWAVRTAEPWTAGSILAVMAMVGVAVALVIVASRRR